MTAFANKVLSDTFANRPPATIGAGYVYLASDSGILYRSTGAAWVQLPSQPMDLFSANASQVLTAAMGTVVYTGNGTGSYTYTLPALSTVSTGHSITIRNAGSGTSTLTVAKDAADTGIFLGFSTAVNNFVLPVGSSVKLAADTSTGNWYLIDGTNFFDEWDDLEMLTGASSSATLSAERIALFVGGPESWRFQPSTDGANPNSLLMGNRQITHGWDRQPVQWHLHFSPETDLVAAGTGIVVTWRQVWRTYQPSEALPWTNEASFDMTYSLASGTLAAANNYNASPGGNNSPTTITNAAASTMVAARLQLVSVTNNGANQTTKMWLSGWDAHQKIRRRGTINPFPEP
jgi:hypothetical protein